MTHTLTLTDGQLDMLRGILSTADRDYAYPGSTEMAEFLELVSTVDRALHPSGDEPYDERDDTLPAHSLDGRPCKGSVEPGYAQTLGGRLHCNYCGRWFDDLAARRAYEARGRITEQGRRRHPAFGNND